MKILRYDDPSFAEEIGRSAAASSLFDEAVEERTRGILREVQAGGDEALSALTLRFDGADVHPDGLAVTKAELLAASLQAGPELRAALALARKNIEAFARKGLRRNWSGRNAQGARVGEKFDPFQRVGIYIPGGTAPLVSTALMTITLAKAAGCPEIVVCTPCGAGGSVNPALLHAVNIAGATEIYRVGGAQAIAAMACGTKRIRPVQKVFGPGNAYVVAAKRLLFGLAAVDLLPGPSEVLVLADDSAKPAFIAADLLAQAEHGSGHERVWLVTASAKILQRVEAELRAQLPQRARRAFIEKTLAGHAWLILVKTLGQGIELANRFAPEHCEIMTRQPARVAEKILTAGAIFLGDNSPTALGDYVAGPSHVLPTGGAARAFAGLTADQFQRRTSLVQYEKPAVRKSLRAVAKFAAEEGLEAHARSVAIRLEAR
jgi:histidinol dehydrogenase